MKDPGPERAPRPESSDRETCRTESVNSIYYYDDGPAGLTVRPAPPNIPRGWYPRPDLRKPPEEGPPSSEPPKQP